MLQVSNYMPKVKANIGMSCQYFYFIKGKFCKNIKQTFCLRNCMQVVCNHWACSFKCVINCWLRETNVKRKFAWDYEDN